MSYPYVMSPNKLKQLLAKLPEISVPKKFTNTTLKSLGFTSSPDYRLIQVIKFVGLADEGGTPTPLWSEFRASPGVALAKGIRQGYSELFAQFPNAHQKDNEALKTFFSAHTEVGVDAVGMIVSTFRAVCEKADFESTAEPQSKHPTKPKTKDTPASDSNLTHSEKVRDGLTVNINVQLQVPPDSSGEVYDKFFEAMKKHLWPK